MSKYMIHVTHNDSDAIGCAIVAKYFESMTSADFTIKDDTYFCAIGTQNDKVLSIIEELNQTKEYPQVFIVSDISLSDEVCLVLQDFCSTNNIELKAFDHHITNHCVENFKWWTVITGDVYDGVTGITGPISAAKIMFEYYKKKLIPNYSPRLEILISMISRYDTWQWKNNPFDWDTYLNKDCPEFVKLKEDLIACICKQLGPEKTYEELKSFATLNIPSFYSKIPDAFYLIYDSNNDREKRYLDKITKIAHVKKVDGNLVAFFMSDGNNTNAACEYINRNCPIIDYTVVLYVAESKISLRSLDEDINVADIAKSFRGGGHKSAAGCEIPPELMVKIVSDYLTDSVTLEEYMNGDK